VIVRTALLITLTAQLASGQGKGFTADCSGNRNLPSCKSYNQMISSKDRDLSSILSGHAYVCFRHDENTFFVISFDEPSKDMFVPTSVPGKSQITGVVKYHRFKDSASDDFRVTAGDWEKTAIGDSKEISFASSSNKAPGSEEQTAAAVNENEIRIGYSFQNREETKVDCELRLRRSTLNFVENYDWADPKTGKLNHSTYTGDCSEFR
jgi:hypothetical protein